MKKTSKLTNQIAFQLAEIIGNGRFQPGQSLIIKKLATEFGVSRQPITNALKLLEEKGLVDAKMNRGFFVAKSPPPKGLLETIKEIDPRDDEPYFKIAEDRLMGRLPDDIMLVDVQKLYKISRSKAQRLLARMAREGWIEQKPGYGWRFLPMLTSPEVYRQSYEFRMVIETAALRSPAYKVDKEAFQELRREIVSVYSSSLSDYSVEYLFQLGCKFHEIIVGCSDNPFYLDSLRRINQLRRLIEYKKKLDHSRVKNSQRQHIELLDLLLDGQIEAAATMMQAHLSRTGKISSSKFRQWISL